MRYYRSSDAIISTGDIEVGTGAVSGLSASATSSGMIGVTAPSTAGTYYYGACVDPVSGESDTGNNCSSAVSVTVTTGGGAEDLPTGEIFALDSANGNPQGITFANGGFHVVDWFRDKVYAYQASGQRDAAADFNLDGDNGSATGITVANDRLYTVAELHHSSGGPDPASLAPCHPSGTRTPAPRGIAPRFLPRRRAR